MFNFLNLNMIFVQLFSVLSLSFFYFSLVLLELESSMLYEILIFKTLGSEVNFVILFDKFSCLFFSVVSLISSCALNYSMEYMSMNFNFSGFSILVFIFVMSMGLVVFSLNTVSIILGWDGLGLSSFLLVIYYNSHKVESAGMITFVFNRFGDSIMVSLAAISLSLGVVDFIKMNSSVNLMMISSIFSGMIKSAQIPFSIWLPEAMAAPTPVSALVHSSTLVTAGVYLIFRFYFMFSEIVLGFLLLLGMITSIKASMMALYEMDLKKIIAYSTLSQLGVMMFSLVYSSKVGFFHLLTHAVFKALMFFSAGTLIFETLNNQDIRKMGKSGFFPLNMLSLNFSNLSLLGLPFMSGCLSKHKILEGMVELKWLSFFFLILIFLSCFLTSVYSFRMMILSSNLSYNSGLGLNMGKDFFSNSMEKSMMILFLIMVIHPVILSNMLFCPSELANMNTIFLKMFSFSFIIGMMTIFFFKMFLFKSKSLAYFFLSKELRSLYSVYSSFKEKLDLSELWVEQFKKMVSELNFSMSVWLGNFWGLTIHYLYLGLSVMMMILLK